MIKIGPKIILSHHQDTKNTKKIGISPWCLCALVVKVREFWLIFWSRKRRKALINNESYLLRSPFENP
jgi:hypothetical protein